MNILNSVNVGPTSEVMAPSSINPYLCSGLCITSFIQMIFQILQEDRGRKNENECINKGNSTLKKLFRNTTCIWVSIWDNKLFHRWKTWKYLFLPQKHWRLQAIIQIPERLNGEHQGQYLCKYLEKKIRTLQKKFSHWVKTFVFIPDQSMPIVFTNNWSLYNDNQTM